MSPTLNIRLLGGPDIRLGNQPIHLETTKTLALLAYLVVRPGPHQREWLANLFWGEQGEVRAARSLRRALWNIRHTLSPGSAEKESPYLIITRQEVAFNHEGPYTLDLETFVHHFQAARTDIQKARDKGSVSPATLRHLHACVNLYRGDFLEGVHIKDAPAFEMWLNSKRAYYQEMAVQVLYHLSEIHTARGEYSEAITALQHLLSLAPWSEWAHRQLMFCYALTGRRADALAQYERCKQILRKELAADPLPETVRLYERIRDPRQFTDMLTRARQEPLPTDPLPPIPFFGRSQEHAWLLARWTHPQGILTVVEGEAGIGKTRLVKEVLRHLQGLGVTVLEGRSHQFGSNIPFHPVSEALRHLLQRAPDVLDTLEPVWLAELARLLPELLAKHAHLPPPVPLEKGAAARQRLFEAVAQALLVLRGNGLAFFLDDVQWADADTIDMLRYLLNRLAEEHIWFVTACRGEELEPGHPFRLLRRDLGRTRRLQTLRLSPLDKESVHLAFTTWCSLPESQGHLLSTYLYARSQGNPFILLEHLRDLVERGVLLQTPQGWEVDTSRLPTDTDNPSTAPFTHHNPNDAIPAPVQDMILERVERLPSSARELLDVAAVLEGEFSRDLLQAVTNVPLHQVDEALMAWFSRGLVQPTSNTPTPGYDFHHPLVRQVIYQNLSQPVRQGLHARVGHTLERLFAGQEEKVLESLAYHFTAAAEREKAVHYLLLAGESVQARQAQKAAVGFYTQALEFIPEEDKEARYRALSGRERAYNQLALREAQAQDLDALWELAIALDDRARQAAVLLRRAEWAMRTARVQEGITAAQKAQRLAQEAGEMGIVVDALRMESMCYVRMGTFERARTCCEKGLQLSQEIGDRHREILCRGTLGFIEMDLNRPEKARQHMEAALAYWRGTEYLWYWAIACNNLSMLYHRLGEYGRALSLQEEARQLIPKTGDIGLEAYSLASLGILYYTVGRYEDALQSFEQALTLARIITDRGFEAYTYTCQGDVYIALEQVDKAEEAYRLALAIEHEVNITFNRPLIWDGLARCALMRNDVEEAERHLTKAEEYFVQEQHPGFGETLALHAFVYTLLNAPIAARQKLRQFQEVIEAPEVEASLKPEAWWWVSRAWEALEEDKAAREALLRAYTLIQRRGATLDEETRATFLTRVPTHQAVLAAVEAR